MFSSFSLCRTTRCIYFYFLFVVLCSIQEFFVTSPKVVRISTMKWRIHVMCLSPCTGPLYLSWLSVFRIRIPIPNTFINPVYKECAISIQPWNLSTTKVKTTCQKEIRKCTIYLSFPILLLAKISSVVKNIFRTLEC